MTAQLRGCGDDKDGIEEVHVCYLFGGIVIYLGDRNL